MSFLCSCARRRKRSESDDRQQEYYRRRSNSRSPPLAPASALSPACAPALATPQVKRKFPTGIATTPSVPSDLEENAVAVAKLSKDAKRKDAPKSKDVKSKGSPKVKGKEAKGKEAASKTKDGDKKDGIKIAPGSAQPVSPPVSGKRSFGTMTAPGAGEVTGYEQTILPRVRKKSTPVLAAKMEVKLTSNSRQPESYHFDAGSSGSDTPRGYEGSISSSEAASGSPRDACTQCAFSDFSDDESSLLSLGKEEDVYENTVSDLRDPSADPGANSETWDAGFLQHDRIWMDIKSTLMDLISDKDSETFQELQESMKPPDLTYCTVFRKMDGTVTHKAREDSKKSARHTFGGVPTEKVSSGNRSKLNLVALKDQSDIDGQKRNRQSKGEDEMDYEDAWTPGSDFEDKLFTPDIDGSRFEFGSGSLAPSAPTLRSESELTLRSFQGGTMTDSPATIRSHGSGSSSRTLVMTEVSDNLVKDFHPLTGQSAKRIAEYQMKRTTESVQIGSSVPQNMDVTEPKNEKVEEIIAKMEVQEEKETPTEKANVTIREHSAEVRMRQKIMSTTFERRESLHSTHAVREGTPIVQDLKAQKELWRQGGAFDGKDFEITDADLDAVDVDSMELEPIDTDKSRHHPKRVTRRKDTAPLRSFSLEYEKRSPQVARKRPGKPVVVQPYTSPRASQSAPKDHSRHKLKLKREECIDDDTINIDLPSPDTPSVNETIQNIVVRSVATKEGDKKENISIEQMDVVESTTGLRSPGVVRNIIAAAKKSDSERPTSGGSVEETETMDPNLSRVKNVVDNLTASLATKYEQVGQGASKIPKAMFSDSKSESNTETIQQRKDSVDDTSSRRSSTDSARNIPYSKIPRAVSSDSNSDTETTKKKLFAKKSDKKKEQKKEQKKPEKGHEKKRIENQVTDNSGEKITVDQQMAGNDLVKTKDTIESIENSETPFSPTTEEIPKSLPSNTSRIGRLVLPGTPKKSERLEKLKQHSSLPEVSPESRFISKPSEIKRLGKIELFIPPPEDDEKKNRKPKRTRNVGRFIQKSGIDSLSDSSSPRESKDVESKEITLEDQLSIQRTLSEGSATEPDIVTTHGSPHTSLDAQFLKFGSSFDEVSKGSPDVIVQCFTESPMPTSFDKSSETSNKSTVDNNYSREGKLGKSSTVFSAGSTSVETVIPADKRSVDSINVEDEDFKTKLSFEQFGDTVKESFAREKLLSQEKLRETANVALGKTMTSVSDVKEKIGRNTEKTFEVSKNSLKDDIIDPGISTKTFIEEKTNEVTVSAFDVLQDTKKKVEQKYETISETTSSVIQDTNSVASDTQNQITLDKQEVTGGALNQIEQTSDSLSSTCKDAFGDLIFSTHDLTSRSIEDVKEIVTDSAQTNTIESITSLCDSFGSDGRDSYTEESFQNIAHSVGQDRLSREIENLNSPTDKVQKDYDEILRQTSPTSFTDSVISSFTSLSRQSSRSSKPKSDEKVSNEATKSSPVASVKQDISIDSDKPVVTIRTQLFSEEKKQSLDLGRFHISPVATALGEQVQSDLKESEIVSKAPTEIPEPKTNLDISSVVKQTLSDSVLPRQFSDESEASFSEENVPLLSADTSSPPESFIPPKADIQSIQISTEITPEVTQTPAKRISVGFDAVHQLPKIQTCVEDTPLGSRPNLNSKQVPTKTPPVRLSDIHITGSVEEAIIELSKSGASPLLDQNRKLNTVTSSSQPSTSSDNKQIVKEEPILDSKLPVSRLLEDRISDARESSQPGAAGVVETLAEDIRSEYSLPTRGLPSPPPLPPVDFTFEENTLKTSVGSPISEISVLSKSLDQSVPQKHPDCTETVVISQSEKDIENKSSAVYEHIPVIHENIQEVIKLTNAFIDNERRMIEMEREMQATISTEETNVCQTEEAKIAEPSVKADKANTNNRDNNQALAVEKSIEDTATIVAPIKNSESIKEQVSKVPESGKETQENDTNDDETKSGKKSKKMDPNEKDTNEVLEGKKSKKAERKTKVKSNTITEKSGGEVKVAKKKVSKKSKEEAEALAQAISERPKLKATRPSARLRASSKSSSVSPQDSLDKSSESLEHTEKVNESEAKINVSTICTTSNDSTNPPATLVLSELAHIKTSDTKTTETKPSEEVSTSQPSKQEFDSKISTPSDDVLIASVVNGGKQDQIEGDKVKQSHSETNVITNAQTTLDNAEANEPLHTDLIQQQKREFSDKTITLSTEISDKDKIQKMGGENVVAVNIDPKTPKDSSKSIDIFGKFSKKKVNKSQSSAELSSDSASDTTPTKEKKRGFLKQRKSRNSSGSDSEVKSASERDRGSKSESTMAPLVQKVGSIFNSMSSAVTSLFSESELKKTDEKDVTCKDLNSETIPSEKPKVDVAHKSESLRVSGTASDFSVSETREVKPEPNNVQVPKSEKVSSSEVSNVKSISPLEEATHFDAQSIIEKIEKDRQSQFSVTPNAHDHDKKRMDTDISTSSKEFLGGIPENILSGCAFNIKAFQEEETASNVKESPDKDSLEEVNILSKEEQLSQVQCLSPRDSLEKEVDRKSSIVPSVSDSLENGQTGRDSVLTVDSLHRDSINDGARKDKSKSPSDSLDGAPEKDSILKDTPKATPRDSLEGSPVKAIPDTTDDQRTSTVKVDEEKILNFSSMLSPRMSFQTPTHSFEESLIEPVLAQRESLASEGSNKVIGHIETIQENIPSSFDTYPKIVTDMKDIHKTEDKIIIECTKSGTQTEARTSQIRVESRPILSPSSSQESAPKESVKPFPLLSRISLEDGSSISSASPRDSLSSKRESTTTFSDSRLSTTDTSVIDEILGVSPLSLPKDWENTPEESPVRSPVRASLAVEENLSSSSSPRDSLELASKRLQEAAPQSPLVNGKPMSFSPKVTPRDSFDLEMARRISTDTLSTSVRESFDSGGAPSMSEQEVAAQFERYFSSLDPTVVGLRDSHMSSGSGGSRRSFGIGSGSDIDIVDFSEPSLMVATNLNEIDESSQQLQPISSTDTSATQTPKPERGPTMLSGSFDFSYIDTSSFERDSTPRARPDSEASPTREVAKVMEELATVLANAEQSLDSDTNSHPSRPDSFREESDPWLPKEDVDFSTGKMDSFFELDSEVWGAREEDAMVMDDSFCGEGDSFDALCDKDREVFRRIAEGSKQSGDLDDCFDEMVDSILSPRSSKAFDLSDQDDDFEKTSSKGRISPYTTALPDISDADAIARQVDSVIGVNTRVVSKEEQKSQIKFEDRPVDDSSKSALLETAKMDTHKSDPSVIDSMRNDGIESSNKNEKSEIPEIRESRFDIAKKVQEIMKDSLSIHNKTEHNDQNLKNEVGTAKVVPESEDQCPERRWELVHTAKYETGDIQASDAMSTTDKANIQERVPSEPEYKKTEVKGAIFEEHTSLGIESTLSSIEDSSTKKTEQSTKENTNSLKNKSVKDGTESDEDFVIEPLVEFEPRSTDNKQDSGIAALKSDLTNRIDGNKTSRELLKKKDKKKSEKSKETSETKNEEHKVTDVSMVQTEPPTESLNNEIHIPKTDTNVPENICAESGTSSEAASKELLSEDDTDNSKAIKTEDKYSVMTLSSCGEENTSVSSSVSQKFEATTQNDVQENLILAVPEDSECIRKPLSRTSEPTVDSNVTTIPTEISKVTSELDIKMSTVSSSNDTQQSSDDEDFIIEPIVDISDTAKSKPTNISVTETIEAQKQDLKPSSNDTVFPSHTEENSKLLSDSDDDFIIEPLVDLDDTVDSLKNVSGKDTSQLSIGDQSQKQNDVTLDSTVSPIEDSSTQRTVPSTEEKTDSFKNKIKEGTESDDDDFVIEPLVDFEPTNTEYKQDSTTSNIQPTFTDNISEGNEGNDFKHTGISSQKQFPNSTLSTNEENATMQTNESAKSEDVLLQMLEDSEINQDILLSLEKLNCKGEEMKFHEKRKAGDWSKSFSFESDKSSEISREGLSKTMSLPSQSGKKISEKSGVDEVSRIETNIEHSKTSSEKDTERKSKSRSTSVEEEKDIELSPEIIDKIVAYQQGHDSPFDNDSFLKDLGLSKGRHPLEQRVDYDSEIKTYSSHHEIDPSIAELNVDVSFIQWSGPIRREKKSRKTIKTSTSRSISIEDSDYIPFDDEKPHSVDSICPKADEPLSGDKSTEKTKKKSKTKIINKDEKDMLDRYPSTSEDETKSKEEKRPRSILKSSSREKVEIESVQSFDTPLQEGETSPSFKQSKSSSSDGSPKISPVVRDSFDPFFTPRSEVFSEDDFFDRSRKSKSSSREELRSFGTDVPDTKRASSEVLFSDTLSPRDSVKRSSTKSVSFDDEVLVETVVSVDVQTDLVPDNEHIEFHEECDPIFEKPRKAKIERKKSPKKKSKSKSSGDDLPETCVRDVAILEQEISQTDFPEIEGSVTSPIFEKSDKSYVTSSTFVDDEEEFRRHSDFVHDDVMLVPRIEIHDTEIEEKISKNKIERKKSPKKKKSKSSDTFDTNIDRSQSPIMFGNYVPSASEFEIKETIEATEMLPGTIERRKSPKKKSKSKQTEVEDVAPVIVSDETQIVENIRDSQILDMESENASFEKPKVSIERRKSPKHKSKSKHKHDSDFMTESPLLSETQESVQTVLDSDLPQEKSIEKIDETNKSKIERKKSPRKSKSKYVDKGFADEENAPSTQLPTSEIACMKEQPEVETTSELFAEHVKISEDNTSKSKIERRKSPKKSKSKHMDETNTQNTQLPSSETEFMKEPSEIEITSELGAEHLKTSQDNTSKSKIERRKSPRKSKTKHTERESVDSTLSLDGRGICEGDSFDQNDERVPKVGVRTMFVGNVSSPTKSDFDIERMIDEEQRRFISTSLSQPALDDSGPSHTFQTKTSQASIIVSKEHSSFSNEDSYIPPRDQSASSEYMDKFSDSLPKWSTVPTKKQIRTRIENIGASAPLRKRAVPIPVSAPLRWSTSLPENIDVFREIAKEVDKSNQKPTTKSKEDISTSKEPSVRAAIDVAKELLRADLPVRRREKSKSPRRQKSKSPRRQPVAESGSLKPEIASPEPPPASPSTRRRRARARRRNAASAQSPPAAPAPVAPPLDWAAEVEAELPLDPEDDVEYEVAADADERAVEGRTATSRRKRKRLRRRRAAAAAAAAAAADAADADKAPAAADAAPHGKSPEAMGLPPGGRFKRLKSCEDDVPSSTAATSTSTTTSATTTTAAPTTARRRSSSDCPLSPRSSWNRSGGSGDDDPTPWSVVRPRRLRRRQQLAAAQRPRSNEGVDGFRFHDPPAGVRLSSGSDGPTDVFYFAGTGGR